VTNRYSSCERQVTWIPVAARFED